MAVVDDRDAVRFIREAVALPGAEDDLRGNQGEGVELLVAAVRIIDRYGRLNETVIRALPEAPPPFGRR